MAGGLFRRTFLKGLLGGVTSAGVVVTATPRDVEAFAAAVGDKPVVLDTAGVLPLQPEVHVGQRLYNECGELVAYVTLLSMEREPIDVTGVGDSMRRVLYRASTVRLEAEVVGSVDITAGAGRRVTMRLQG